MQTVYAESALLDQAWSSKVRITVDSGVIRGIETNAEANPDDWQVGKVLPGIPNAHSHAFQRALAGRTELKAGSNENFWTWRNAMYEVCGMLDPEQLRVVAELVYMEMLEAGYTSVAEFHYLHHRPSGRPYDPVTQLIDVQHEAAVRTGIRLTMIPTLYMRSSFDDTELKPEQLRFGHSTESFTGLLDEIRGKNCGGDVGIGLHSLRAVPLTAIEAVTEYAHRKTPSAPFHIHVAEQQREVDECLAATGRRPIEYLLDNCDIDERWSLVHATHATPDELVAVAAKEATVVLCPTTEANLGDGLFRLPDFNACGGQFAIGSDSQICVDPFAEMQMLEYGQRLAHQRRAVSATDERPHTGASLFTSILAGGRASVNQKCGRIAKGHCADLIVVNSLDPRLAGLSEDQLLDALVFAGPRNPVEAVMVAGSWVVKSGRHALRDEISSEFHAVMVDLFSRK